MSGDGTSISAKRILVAGASGTIGRAVVRAALDAGHETFALLRTDSERPMQVAGSTVLTDDIGDASSLSDLLRTHSVEVVISCLASRTGSPKDAEAVDFLANLNLLKACEAARVEHFILLSAICVQRPRLAFQHAKIAFERALKASSVEHTIVRPTAFFKSLSGQVDRVLAGKPFAVFADGELTRCKPISDADLARYLLDCATLAERRGQVLPIGGPGPAMTQRQQGELLFEAAGKAPKFRSVPVAMFDIAAAALSLGARFSNWCAEKAEYARIGRYYATESMLVFNEQTQQYDANATPEFGEDTLLDHYKALVAARESE